MVKRFRDYPTGAGGCLASLDEPRDALDNGVGQPRVEPAPDLLPISSPRAF